MPGGGGTQWLPRLVASGDAYYMLFTGEPVGAEEALQMRLVQRVVESEQLVEEAMSMANKICENGQIAVRLVKETVKMGLDVAHQRCVDVRANRISTRTYIGG